MTELFAGAGLLSGAFQSAGFAVTQAWELDPVAAETYRRNVGDHIEVADLRKVQPQGKCDVLLAGPPCQGFSTLGSRRLDDPRNDLCLVVANWARLLRPRFVVIENVPEFLTSPSWRRMARRLDLLGFHISTLVLDAFDYGCAQRRRRSFTIASVDGRDCATTPRTKTTTVREAWEGLPTRPDGNNNHYAPKPSDLALARMRVIPKGGDRRDVLERAPHLVPPSWRRLRCQVTDAWGRMTWDEPANTLRTCLQNPSKGRYIHPTQHRVISLREAARLHGIDDGWTFAGLPTQIARQIGNSVPPDLGRAVARSVLRIL